MSASLVNGPNWPVAGAVLVLGYLLALGIRAKKHRWRIAFGLLASVWVAAAFGGCGGGSRVSMTDPGTLVGTYSLTVTATSGTVSQTVNVSVAVE